MIKNNAWQSKTKHAALSLSPDLQLLQRRHNRPLSLSLSLKLMVGDSWPHDLPSTSSSLLDFFLNLHQFHQVIRDLADPEKALCGKNKNLALEFKEKGNRCHLSGDHPQALISYSQKMGLLMECLRDCNRALQISSTYAKMSHIR
ncbi:hypothetical protein CFOL_v3_19152 [Cephalotus follicularis]|uniref:TPR_11 domain-containing protein n=1 Tax=Cephalotus follicularis TaxID=3775 RepID=A0A1Q3C655_CEPFO|nr:hypothetical protein CFOL_v3_19152 [Cephalotus follicularis]